LQLGKEFFFTLGNICLALIQCQFSQVPSLLGDLLFRFLAVEWIGADAGVGFFVDAFDLEFKFDF
jgi:hypothetical protein